MQPKIYWIDNLRGIACLMVVMIHTTTWYVINAHSVSPITWDIANVLNSASRVSVPLFFMISGYLFFGERSAQSRHFLRIGLCLFFYSAIALLYIALFTSINVELALKNLLQKPVFYHLWFFFAIAVIYLVSPLIQVKNVGGKMLLVLMVVIGIIANPNTVPQKIDGFEWLPINLYGIAAMETLLPALFHLLLAMAIRFCKLNNPMMSRIASDLRQRHVQP